MSCSSKRKRHIGSCSSTLVSRTKSLAAPEAFARLLVRAAGAGAAAVTAGGAAGAGGRRVSIWMLTSGAGAGDASAGDREAGAAGNGLAGLPPSRSSSSNNSIDWDPGRGEASVRRSEARLVPRAGDGRTVDSSASGVSNAARLVGAGGKGMDQIARRKRKPKNKKAA
ncbi:hypothetical protein VARIO8X_90679 [Burkholderiales bacterium 8X]|nr:hypothetical protein VARIO8X_90679 [Burkholderiales bacterium 8X]